MSTQWHLLCLYFTEETCGVKLVYDQLDTPHADIRFSKIIITHSVSKIFI